MDSKINQALSELNQLIRQYIEESEKHEASEDMTWFAYILLGELKFEDNLFAYTFSSVSALAAIATTDVHPIILQKMGKDNFENLCKMLERVVGFCS